MKPEARNEEKDVEEKHGIIETAKQMIKNNIDINIIQKCTGLSLNEVKRL
mgnify:FL=1